MLLTPSADTRGHGRYRATHETVNMAGLSDPLADSPGGRSPPDVRRWPSSVAPVWAEE